MESKYSFRKRLEQVHVFSRDLSGIPRKNEIAVDDSWEIVISAGAGLIVSTVADDLKDYFQVSMGVCLSVSRLCLRDESGRGFKRKIVVGTFDELSVMGAEKGDSVISSRIVCDGTGILVAGSDEKLAGRGCYELENIMNLRKGPFMKKGSRDFKNRFSPRMIHSGWDYDAFPENYLRKIAHSGFDSVLVYYKRSDASSREKIAEVQCLIKRASALGIGVYLYLHAWRDYDTMHPSEPGAEDYYDSFYGQAFKNHPDATGCVIVGESCAFPSRDPEVKDIRNNSGDNSKPHPGWWPCMDYPQWLELVKKIIVRHKPDADIVFWTYNWGWAPEKKRLELIRNLPSGISLLVTFEMFEAVFRGKMKEYCADYTIKFAGPGKYFASEAKAAKDRGLKLYAMSNTGGMTWDFGVVPYIPVPFQWSKRWKKLLEARKEWGLSGLMESHHYGWHPSYVSSLGEYFSNSANTDNPDRYLSNLLDRDFGIPSRKHLIKAYRLWSRAIKLLPATAYDQYGVLRVGPSYPFHFSEASAPNMPSDTEASFGSRIVEPLYSPEGFFTRQIHEKPIGERVEHELRSVREMCVPWQCGIDEVEAGLSKLSGTCRPEYLRILALGEFIGHTLRSLVNIKIWWKLRMELKTSPSSDRMDDILDEMIRTGVDEIGNAEETMGIVGMDSRLGWEPTMGYLTDKDRLSWKIGQLRNVIDKIIPEYRITARLNASHDRFSEKDLSSDIKSAVCVC